MTYLYKQSRYCCIGIFLLVFTSTLLIQPIQAQCDFINDITGITQTTPPTGNAADPTQYTQRYVLVDNEGIIYAVGTTPDFLGVPAGNYDLYAVNFENSETPAVSLVLSAGLPWLGVTAYGDDPTNCLDYTAPYGSGCPIVVCDETIICEYDVFSQTANGFLNLLQTQTYCLVCNDVVQAVDGTGTFDLSAFPAATGGANCQVYALNYMTADGIPVTAGDAWSVAFTDLCNDNACFDFVGMNLDITPLSQTSGSGVSTTVDWWDTSDGCGGAQTSTNGGGTFSETVNNICIPPYDQGNIDARPDEVDDLYLLSIGQSARFACSGNLDLTQAPVFYTVECDPTEPSLLEVTVSNPGGNITGIQAALYGPVNAACPTITGGTFVDCDDSGTGATSGAPLGDLLLTTNTNPGETYIVIVDTEGEDFFTISSTVTLLNTSLQSFSGHKEEVHNRLEWSTAEEEGLRHFVLERSLDAVNFEAITTVQAIGQSSTAQSYQYWDEYPGVGTKYYRLQMVHHDGSIEQSHVVALTRTDEDRFSYVTVVPNPSIDGNFSVQFEANSDNDMEIEVYDMIGRSVLNRHAEIVSGINTLTVDLGDMPAATYILSLSVDGYRINRRLVKSK
jgi:hypothetical protein